MHVAGLVLEKQHLNMPLPLEILFADGGDRFVFDERVNVFIGPNASGKSSVLKAIWEDLPKSERRPVGHDSRWDQGTMETQRSGKLQLANWRFAQFPVRGFFRGPFPKPVPVIAVPATRIPAKKNAELPSPEAFLAAAGREADGMTPSDLAGLMLNQSIDGTLYAEQVQHATDLLISLAEHKSKNDAHDAFDRRLAAAKLVSGKDMEDLWDQIKSEIGGRLRHGGHFSWVTDPNRPTPNVHRIAAAIQDDVGIHQLAANLGVSDVQVSLAMSWLIENGDPVRGYYGEDYYENLAIQASYSVDIDDEDTFTYASGVTSRAFANFHKAIGRSQICVQQICNEILSAKRPQHISYQTTDVVQGVVHERSRTIHAVDVSVVPRWLRYLPADDYEQPGFALLSRQPVYELSAGTEMTLWWVRLIALNLLYHADFQFGWEKQPAILLIDEIENHLHPTWQRRVIPALLEHFPGLQIFATTHSPFVVAGLKAGQVHVLKPTQLREIKEIPKRGIPVRFRYSPEDDESSQSEVETEEVVYVRDVVKASSNTEDIVGWTMDEVLRRLMGVSDPTDERTATAARELRDLRNEGRRADEVEEEKRQARMQELRRLVDRDLLAGGPKARRREEFAREFAEAMERRRQSESLNQENG